MSPERPSMLTPASASMHTTCSWPCMTAQEGVVTAFIGLRIRTVVKKTPDHVQSLGFGCLPGKGHAAGSGRIYVGTLVEEHLHYLFVSESRWHKAAVQRRYLMAIFDSFWSSSGI